MDLLSNGSPATLSPSRLDDWIHLNIGGREFITSRATLILEEPESMLAKMFGGQRPDILAPASRDSQGRYIIDRSPEYFAPLLNYLRTGVLMLDKNINPQGVLQEARFYGLEGVITKLEDMLASDEEKDPPLTRKDVVKTLMGASPGSSLRFQGVNLRGADLSRLDLSNINMKVRLALVPGTFYQDIYISIIELAGLFH